MDQKLLHERESRCSQENPPGCTAACPAHVDARGLINAVRKKDYKAGFALLQRMLPFPGIISSICDQPCQQQCKRTEIDDAISIRALEKFCVDNNKAATPALLFPPAKSQTVAIIGAGLSSLTVAFELSRKGYQLTIFEATSQLGGSLRHLAPEVLSPSVLENELAIFAKMPLQINFNTTITSLAQLCADFDAVYLGTGKKGAAALAASAPLPLALNEDGSIKTEPVSLATSQTGIFAGGSLRLDEKKASAIYAIADGKKAAISLDRFLQNASLTASREKEDPFTSTLYTNIAAVKTIPIVKPSSPDGNYTQAEAFSEAERCLYCECLECVKVCPYLAHYRGYPKKYVREIYNNLSIVMGIHHANKMINSCSLCGLCAEVCPGKLNMGEICREAREMMVDKNKMPPSAHDFALLDLKFSNSEQFALARHQPGHSTSKWLFYPGCQLSASLPHYVQQIYSFLCSKLKGGVALQLGCCGAPAYWAGQKAGFQETMQNLSSVWQELGNPTIITACPSCYRLIQEHLPGLAAQNLATLWTVLEETGLPNNHTEQPATDQKNTATVDGDSLTLTKPLLAIHDSCSTRHDAKLQQSIRNILQKLGYQFTELNLNRENTVCCSYGGLMQFANPEIAAKVVKQRIEESELDYLTYCAMCRDNFASQGKRTYHLLDLIWGEGKSNLAAQASPGWSVRQENRTKLKAMLLQEIWGETLPQTAPTVKVFVSDDVLKSLEEKRILLTDVSQVINYAETTGNKLRNTDKDSYVSYLQLGSVTFWVEYQPQDDGFAVRNAYCHRLEISVDSNAKANTAPAHKSTETIANMLCLKCTLPLTLGKATLSYLGSSFPVELHKCPQCNLVFIPEELVTSKMQQVETALEDK